MFIVLLVPVPKNETYLPVQVRCVSFVYDSDVFHPLPCSVCVVCSISMAVPFVEDWDLVQTLGEGAYGEWVALNKAMLW